MVSRGQGRSRCRGGVPLRQRPLPCRAPVRCLCMKYIFLPWDCTGGKLIDDSGLAWLFRTGRTGKSVARQCFFAISVSRVRCPSYRGDDGKISSSQGVEWTGKIFSEIRGKIPVPVTGRRQPRADSRAGVTLWRRHRPTAAVSPGSCPPAGTKKFFSALILRDKME